MRCKVECCEKRNSSLSNEKESALLKVLSESKLQKHLSNIDKNSSFKECYKGCNRLIVAMLMDTNRNEMD